MRFLRYKDMFEMFGVEEFEKILDEEKLIEAKLEKSLTPKQLELRRETLVISGSHTMHSFNEEALKMSSDGATKSMKELLKKADISEIEKLLTPWEFYDFNDAYKQFKKTGKVSCGFPKTIVTSAEEKKIFKKLLEQAKKRR